MNVFWNADERRLRVLWRLIAQAAIMVGLAVIPIVAIAEPLTALDRRGLFLAAYGHDAYDRVVNMLVGPFLAAAVIGSVVLAARWLDHRPMSDLGARVDRRFWNGLALGLTVGTVVMTLVFVVEYAFGWIVPTGRLVVNATAVRVTGRLSTAIGAHIAWNFVQGAVFGFPVSGDKEGASLIGIEQGGPPLLTGGAFGPEAGLFGALASTVGIVAMLAWGRWRPRHERPTPS